MVVMASTKSWVSCYSSSWQVVCSSHQAGGAPCFEWEHLQCCAALFSTSTFCIKKVALLTRLAHADLFLRTKAVSHRSAASSGHRQKIVGGRINMNEEMEKAISRQGIMKDLVEVVFDFPVCVERCDDPRKWIKISNSYLITSLTPFFNMWTDVISSKENPKWGTWYSYCSEYLRVCYRNPLLWCVCKNKSFLSWDQRGLCYIFSIWDTEIRLGHFPGDTPITCAVSTNTSARSSTPELPFSFFPSGPFYGCQIKTYRITNCTFQ